MLIIENSIFSQSLSRALNFLNYQTVCLNQNNSLFDAFALYRPLIYFGYKLDNSLIRLFKKHNNVKVFQVVDNLNEEQFVLLKELMDIVDLTCISHYEEEHLNQYININKLVNLSYGADTLLYKRGEFLSNFYSDIVYDNPSDEYSEFVYSILNSGLNIKLFGSTSNRYNILPQYLGFLTDNQLCSAYSSSNFGLTFNNSDLVISPEFYKIFVCGGLCLTNNKCKIIVDKLSDKCIIFSDKEEMIEKVNFIKAHPKIREEIVEKSLVWAEEQSYIERAKQFLNLL